MRILVALAVVAVLAIAGLVGFVVVKERQRAAQPSPTTGMQATKAKVETIAFGDRVDIAAKVPLAGYTVVEFTADF